MTVKIYNSVSRDSGYEPCVLDDSVLARQMEERQAQIAAYRQYRQLVEQQRHQDRINRNRAKIQQLEIAEKMQVCLSSSTLYKIQNIRQKFFRQVKKVCNDFK